MEVLGRVGYCLMVLGLIVTINGQPQSEERSSGIQQFDLLNLWGGVSPALQKINKNTIVKESDEKDLLCTKMPFNQYSSFKIQSVFILKKRTLLLHIFHAACDLRPFTANSRYLHGVFGRIKLRQNIIDGKAGPLRMSIEIEGVPTRRQTWGMFYKLEIHKYGDVTQGCQNVGPVFWNKQYSGHLGDFVGDMYGSVTMETMDAPSTLVGDYSIFGRAIVLRRVFQHDPVGCCVVVRDRIEKLVAPPPPLEAKLEATKPMNAAETTNGLSVGSYTTNAQFTEQTSSASVTPASRSSTTELYPRRLRILRLSEVLSSRLPRITTEPGPLGLRAIANIPGLPSDSKFPNLQENRISFPFINNFFFATPEEDKPLDSKRYFLSPTDYIVDPSNIFSDRIGAFEAFNIKKDADNITNTIKDAVDNKGKVVNEDKVDNLAKDVTVKVSDSVKEDKKPRNGINITKIFFGLDDNMPDVDEVEVLSGKIVNNAMDKITDVFKNLSGIADDTVGDTDSDILNDGEEITDGMQDIFDFVTDVLNEVPEEFKNDLDINDLFDDLDFFSDVFVDVHDDKPDVFSDDVLDDFSEDFDMPDELNDNILADLDDPFDSVNDIEDEVSDQVEGDNLVDDMQELLDFVTDVLDDVPDEFMSELDNEDLFDDMDFPLNDFDEILDDKPENIGLFSDDLREDSSEEVDILGNLNKDLFQGFDDTHADKLYNINATLEGIIDDISEGDDIPEEFKDYMLDGFDDSFDSLTDIAEVVLNTAEEQSNEILKSLNPSGNKADGVLDDIQDETGNAFTEGVDILSDFADNNNELSNDINSEVDDGITSFKDFIKESNESVSLKFINILGDNTDEVIEDAFSDDNPWDDSDIIGDIEDDAVDGRNENLDDSVDDLTDKVGDDNDILNVGNTAETIGDAVNYVVAKIIDENTLGDNFDDAVELTVEPVINSSEEIDRADEVEDISDLNDTDSDSFDNVLSDNDDLEVLEDVADDSSDEIKDDIANTSEVVENYVENISDMVEKTLEIVEDTVDSVSDDVDNRESVVDNSIDVINDVLKEQSESVVNTIDTAVNMERSSEAVEDYVDDVSNIIGKPAKLLHNIIDSLSGGSETPVKIMESTINDFKDVIDKSSEEVEVDNVNSIPENTEEFFGDSAIKDIVEKPAELVDNTIDGISDFVETQAEVIDNTIDVINDVIEKPGELFNNIIESQSAELSLDAANVVGEKPFEVIGNTVDAVSNIVESSADIADSLIDVSSNA